MIAGLIALILAASLFGMPEQQPKGSSIGQWGSSYNKDDEGLMALYLLLEEKGQALRWERPPARLSDQVDRLLLWEPFGISTSDWEAVLTWVRQGHTLILAGEINFYDWPDRRAAPRIAARQDGPASVASWAEGKGQVHWLPHGGLLTNGQISQEGHLQEALQLLTPTPGDIVYFDEYYHGYRTPERWWQVLRGSLKTFVLQLGVAILLFYWAFALRFGRPRPVPPTPPRTAISYVFSLSQLYRQARAGQVVQEQFYNSLRREMGRLLGAGLQGMSHAEIAQRAASRLQMAPEQILSLLDRAAPDGTVKRSDKELITLGCELEALQGRIRNAGYRDRTADPAGAQ